MTTELITFNHLSCHSSSTALLTRAIIELGFINVNEKERETKREKVQILGRLISTKHSGRAMYWGHSVQKK